MVVDKHTINKVNVIITKLIVVASIRISAKHTHATLPIPSMALVLHQ